MQFFGIGPWSFTFTMKWECTINNTLKYLPKANHGQCHQYHGHQLPTSVPPRLTLLSHGNFVFTWFTSWTKMYTQDQSGEKQRDVFRFCPLRLNHSRRLSLSYTTNRASTPSYARDMDQHWWPVDASTRRSEVDSVCAPGATAEHKQHPTLRPGLPWLTSWGAGKIS